MAGCQHNTAVNVFNSGVISTLGQRTLHRKCWNSFGGVSMLTGKDADLRSWDRGVIR